MLFNKAGSPIPETWRIWGVWIEPAARMTSFFALTVAFLLPLLLANYETLA